MDKNLNNLFVISSPSGGGKSSLIEALLSDPNAKRLSLSISLQQGEGDLMKKMGKIIISLTQMNSKKKLRITIS